jgi:hypothetical protein
LTKANSDDEDEVFQDVDRLAEESKAVETIKNKKITKKLLADPYDPLKREPSFSNAEGAPIWELV